MNSSSCHEPFASVMPGPGTFGFMLSACQRDPLLAPPEQTALVVRDLLPLGGTDVAAVFWVHAVGRQSIHGCKLPTITDRRLCHEHR